MERFSIKKLYDVEVKEQYQVKVSSRFAALENVGGGGTGGGSGGGSGGGGDRDSNRAGKISERI
jgi:uncharacterized membrane protein